MPRLTEKHAVLTWDASAPFADIEVQYPSKVTIRVGSDHVAVRVADASAGRIELCPHELHEAVKRSVDRLNAERRGGHRPTDVELAPLRIEALRQIQGHEVTWSDIAWRAGYKRTDKANAADISRLKRDLGLYDGAKRYVRYETAVRLADALSCDPVDLGF